MQHEVLSRLSLKGVKVAIRKGSKWDTVRLKKPTKIHPVSPTPEAINRYVNKLMYYTREDKDYWQTPDESYALRRGDCEDYAIFKYALLQQAGYDPILLVGYDKDLMQTHAVTAVADQGIVKILDNCVDRVVQWNEINMQAQMAYALYASWAIAE